MTYHAAVALYFDTSEAAQKAGLLTISVMDMQGIEPLPPGATHRFYVLINGTAAYVNRTSKGYTVEPDARKPPIAQELAIREKVLDTAIEYFTSETPYPNNDLTQKPRIIDELLEDTEEEIKHPVVKDELPDNDLSGKHQPKRQWSVRIGDNYCEVGLFQNRESQEAYLEVI